MNNKERCIIITEYNDGSKATFGEERSGMSKFKPGMQEEYSRVNVTLTNKQGDNNNNH